MNGMESSVPVGLVDVAEVDYGATPTQFVRAAASMPAGPAWDAPEHARRLGEKLRTEARIAQATPEQIDALFAAAKPEDGNPKDAIGATKLPLQLVSGFVKAYLSIALFLGNVKYGAWNFRGAGVRASIYLAALARHVDLWNEGQENDPVDDTPHLANALACLAIIIEAKHAGTLIDDRPPSSDLSAVYADLTPLMAKIKARYAHIPPPKHYTIADTKT